MPKPGYVEPSQNSPPSEGHHTPPLLDDPSEEPVSLSEVPLESWDPSPNEAWESDPQHRPTRSFSPQLAGEGASAPSNSDPSPQGSGTQTPPRGEPATPSHELGLLSQDMQSDTPRGLDPVSPVPSDGRETSSEGPLDTSCTPASHDIVVHSTLPLSGPSVNLPPASTTRTCFPRRPPKRVRQ